jgi:hypothetical protein
MYKGWAVKLALAWRPLTSDYVNERLMHDVLLVPISNSKVYINVCCMQHTYFIYVSFVIILQSSLAAMFTSWRYKNILVKSIRLHTSHCIDKNKVKLSL